MGWIDSKFDQFCILPAIFKEFALKLLLVWDSAALSDITAPRSDGSSASDSTCWTPEEKKQPLTCYANTVAPRDTLATKSAGN